MRASTIAANAGYGRNVPASLTNSGAVAAYNYLVGTLPPGNNFTRAAGSQSNTNLAGTLVYPGTNVPRFESNGLLLEAANTNLYKFSQDVTNAVWNADSNGKSQVTNTTSPNPDGTTTINRFTSTSGGAWFPRNTSGTLTNGVTYTIECYVRSFGSDPTTTQLTLVDGAFHLGSNITLTNAWQKVSFTRTATAGGTDAGFKLTSPASAGFGIEYFGFDVKAAPFAESYIPTTSTTATRAAENLTVSNPAWFNPIQGTIVAKVMLEGINASNPQGVCYLSDGSANNRLEIRANSGAGASQFILTQTGNLVINQPGPLPSVGVATGFAMSYSTGGIIMAQAGALVASVPGPITLPVGINILGLGDTADGSSFKLGGWEQNFAFYNTAQNQAQTIALSA